MSKKIYKMNKDDLDIFRHLDKTPKISSGLDLIKGLNDRKIGLKSNPKTKENVQLFAEEQLVRKAEYTEMRCEMPGMPRSTFLMVFSPDGQRAASTHGNHNIYVTDLRSGKNIKTLVGHPRTPWCIAFHPTSDQIVASGCLGGQVRIWDLSGGSEMWTTANQSVIASIAFHPNDRVLVIATTNEVYFWDWSHRQPFLQTATNNPREKVRYVAFDKLGHKLITGIANSPQTRWERARAPVPVPRQERCASPYRRRITQRLVSASNITSNTQPNSTNDSNVQEREPSAGMPERERRIALCYRDLVREYELLVHRYLQLYRPPTMIDRGTDPMEPNHYTSGTQTAESSSNDNAIPGPSGLGNQSSSRNETSTTESNISNSQPSALIDTNPQPSTSHSQNLITPSRIFSVGRKPPSSIRGTQTQDSRKHKNDEEPSTSGEKRLKRKRGGSQSENSSSSRDSSPRNEHNAPEVPAGETNSGTTSDRVLVITLDRINPDRLPTASTAEPTNDEDFNYPRCRARYKRRVYNLINNHRNGLPTSRTNNTDTRPSTSEDRSRASVNSSSDTPPTSTNRYSERFNQYIRQTREKIAEFRRRTRNVLSTEGSSDVTSHETTEGDGNVSPPAPTINNDHSVPGTSNQERPNEVSGSNQQSNVEELLSNIRRTAEEEVRNRILPIIRSVPPPDRPELIRLFENSREHVRMRFRQMYPVFLRRHCRRTLRIDSSTDSSSSENEQDQSSAAPSMLPPRVASDLNLLQNTISPDTSTAIAPTSSGSTERNFNTELEQLVTTLLTEIERSDDPNSDVHTASAQAATQNNSASTSSARTRPSRIQWPNNENSLRRTPPPGESLENILYEPVPEAVRSDLYSRFQSDFPSTTQHAPVSSSNGDTRNSYLNTDTRTTNSTIYTSSSSSPGQRRRFFSHRVSAFMPTRVNYTRTRFRRNPHYTWGSGRAERGGADEWISPNFPTIGSSSDAFNPESVGIGSMYSNIVQDVQSSLDDARNIGASRPGETSDMLNSFTERLENIMSQSEAILRNLRTSMDLLPNTSEAGRSQLTEPRWNFNDPGFYVRDLRSDAPSNSESNVAGDSSLHDWIGSLHAIATDHTYPRNPNNPSASDNMSPVMTSLHLSLSHIQRQAGLLRRQVENIERIDRAMIEVGQVKLLRELLAELAKYMNPGGGGGGSRTAGVSNVRQMMAGTRISDSGPYESPNEEGNAASRSSTQGGDEIQPQPGTSSGTTSSTDQPSTSSGTTQQRRSTNRKTYPPSRFARHYRGPSIIHLFSRRYNRFERGIRQCQNRSCGTRPTSSSTPSSSSQPLNYSTIDESTVSSMITRVRRLLTEQMRIFTRTQEGPSPPRSTVSFDLGEHILALRLHGCWLRMNRVLGSRLEYSALRAMRSNNTAPVSHDGFSRYTARHSLSLIVDGMSRHIEELGRSNFSSTLRKKIQCMLTLSILLTELLLHQIRDSIPPPTEVNLDAERESLTRRIDEICSEMGQNRANAGTAQFTASLRIMTFTMRHAHRTLDETYVTRRDAIMPTHSLDRRNLLGIINRCLSNISRFHQESDSDGESNPRPSTSQGPPDVGNSSGVNANGNESSTEAMYTTVSDFFRRFSENRVNNTSNQPSTSRERLPTRDSLLSSTNENSDEDGDYPEPEWYYQRTSNNSSNNSNLYRTNNVNLVQQNEPAYQTRWNVPSVQVNDVPVSEPSFVAQRLLNHRQRMSDLRNPRAGIYRPRFLHPLYAHVNPFDADLDDPQREQIYDSDMIATVTPNHRIQAWDISNWTIPSISSSLRNVVVNECKIHNDASVDIATDGTILVTLLPSGGYLNVTNRLGVYSLRWETLGQCLYTTSFEQNAVSVSLSPLSRHLLVGFASRRVSIIPSDRWVMARIYKIEQKDVPGDSLPVLRDLEQQRESRINCIRWLPTSGQGLIYATNTGQLVILS
ncbi:uncharacterized protein LOC143202769 isoform X2 [Rhynchophorus ferrugineus]|uniref:uncharacterized protein LOC143202769 isoform X2 n=2 Tax=Rhynchophorus ferrugineus TaxID=354439 RepID=UPI003FCEE43B